MSKARLIFIKRSIYFLNQILLFYVLAITQGYDIYTTYIRFQDKRKRVKRRLVQTSAGTNVGWDKRQSHKKVNF